MASPEHPRTPVPALADLVAAELTDFLDGHTALLLDIHPDLQLLAELARSAVLGGGKRLRPTFAYWGWRSVLEAGAAGEAELIRGAASLELLQACALVHDDLMDASDTRRGEPAAHVRFAAAHAAAGWPGPAAKFGQAGAVLLGDLLLSWAEEMFSAAFAALPPARAAAAGHQFDLMRTEVVAGQFLDVLAQTRGAFDPDEALRVIRFKTSKYTVERPLLLGAAAAGAGTAVQFALASYGQCLGEAFQLRDDLLGVYGDPARTGKPAGDDLREGKRTLLVALAAAAAERSGDTAARAAIESGVGDPALDDAGVQRLRQLLSDTGARAAVETRIADRAADAVAALGDGLLLPQARAALADLARSAAHRSF